MPEIVERRQVPRLDNNHPIIRRAPNVGILTHNRHILRQFLLEPLPFHFSLPLISLSKRPNTIEDQESKYQHTIALARPSAEPGLITFSIHSPKASTRILTRPPEGYTRL